jgi:CDP-6-deoxy-D-xylo-4-hexulose-3-dehydrase
MTCKYRIPLNREAISKQDLKECAKWLKKTDQLTMGEITIKFEEELKKFLGSDRIIVTNSGSSANLLLASAILNHSKTLRNNKVILPAVSWVTTVAPFIQLGFNPILCDADNSNLGLDKAHFEYLCRKEKPSLAVAVHVLGHSGNIDDYLSICKKYDVIFLEDTCEAFGSQYNNKCLGTFGAAGTFSFYYSHQLSTIEGGAITVKDLELHNIIKSMRAHGWSRDIDTKYQKKWANKHNVSEFYNLYAFYYPGYNMRPNEITSFLGLLQLKRFKNVIKKRNAIYQEIKAKLKDDIWVQSSEATRLSTFAVGVVVKNRDALGKLLMEKDIECRPLICGNIGKQPFWTDRYGENSFPTADIIHNNGLYLPCNENMSSKDIGFLVNNVNKFAVPLEGFNKKA